MYSPAPHTKKNLTYAKNRKPINGLYRNLKEIAIAYVRHISKINIAKIQETAFNRQNSESKQEELM